MYWGYRISNVVFLEFNKRCHFVTIIYDTTYTPVKCNLHLTCLSLKTVLTFNKTFVYSIKERRYL